MYNTCQAFLALCTRHLRSVLQVKVYPDFIWMLFGAEDSFVLPRHPPTGYTSSYEPNGMPCDDVIIALHLIMALTPGFAFLRDTAVDIQTGQKLIEKLCNIKVPVRLYYVADKQKLRDGMRKSIRHRFRLISSMREEKKRWYILLRALSLSETRSLVLRRRKAVLFILAVVLSRIRSTLP